MATVEAVETSDEHNTARKSKFVLRRHDKSSRALDTNSGVPSTSHCQQLMGAFGGYPETVLLDLCQKFDFSKDTCLSAKGVLAGRDMTPHLAAPVYAALLQTPTSVSLANEEISGSSF